MSRIGRMPITLGTGVEAKLEGKVLTVKGPKGTLSESIENSKIKCNIEGNVIHFTREGEDGVTRAAHGLYRALAHNMVVGVSEGFKRSLIINGVGYKAQVSGNKLILNIGYSHPVEVEAPEGIKFECPTLTEIVVSGIDKEVVGQTAANIKAKRVVEPYHAYGIRYKEEVVVLKEGKTNK